MPVESGSYASLEKRLMIGKRVTFFLNNSQKLNLK